jgi:alkylated DNA nucleotide flippase Atl1
MHVQETSFAGMVQGQKQFRVPLFQRQYKWTTKDHGQLWSDILDHYELLLAGQASSHFIGSFVLAPIGQPASADVSTYLVVDGQQRLTTLTLALCAIRDTAAATDPAVVDKYNELYLLNKWQSGLGRYRLIPTQKDRDALFAALDGESGRGGLDTVGSAYRYFRAALSQPGPSGEPLDLERLTSVITQRLVIVDITTGPGDNPHRIFESLNATGVSLTQADLLRNYLFMMLPTRGDYVYQRVWLPLEESLGVEHLEGLARADLQRRGADVTKDDVYRRHQERLDPIAHDEALVEAEVRDLVLRGEHYGRLIRPELEPDTVVRRHLHFLRRWGAQTTYPLLMYMYDLLDRRLCGTEELREVALSIESFLVRRQIAGVPTNQLNRLFVQMLPNLPADASVAEAVKHELSTERRYWPTDAQLREAARTRPFYFMGRGHQRKMILERLERTYPHKEFIDLENAPLSIEHIMPQTLSTEWRQHLESLGQDPDEVREKYVHTIGNLTLTGYNTELSNKPLERKREIYEYSHLEMNRGLADLDKWGAEEILARSDELASRAIEIWPSPVAGVAAAERRFDWTHVDAAVAAIPAGRWTSYSDLAELAGTSAVAVGQRMANALDNSFAYRVLGSDGHVSPGFRWTDSAKSLDPRRLLGEEGIIFLPSGEADPSQRLSAEALQALVTSVADDFEPGQEADDAAA